MEQFGVAIGGGDECDRYFQALKVDAEIKLLAQERDYLKSASATAVDKNALAFGTAELERLRKNHELADSALKEKAAEKVRLKDSMRNLDFLNPWSQDRQELMDIERAHKELRASNQRAYEAWLRQKNILDTFKVPKGLPKFELRSDPLQQLTVNVKQHTF